MDEENSRTRHLRNGRGAGEEDEEGDEEEAAGGHGG